MRKIFRKNRIIPTLLVQISVLTAGLMISTVAWFSNIRWFEPENVKSGIITSYFDSGSGTENDPYVITRPIHYYNLVYLQENDDIEYSEGVKFYEAELWFEFGKLNADGIGGNADDNVYTFYDYDNNGVIQYVDVENEIEATTTYLNMNYYSGDKAILPLGSSTHPFKGHIKGHDLTVKNLNITGNGLADIGIFGYVANGASISHAYFDNVNIDTKLADPTGASAQSHSAHTGAAYIGSIAGHVHNAATTFEHVYVNNVNVYNSVANTTESISNYGYFGHSDEPTDIISDSSSYNIKVDPKSAYEAIDEAHTNHSTKDLTTRNTEYNASGTLNNAVSKSGDSYTIGDNATASKPYSLSTVGYKTGGDSAYDYVRYVDNYNNNRLTMIDSTTTKLTESNIPNDWNNADDGYYIYYQGTNWKYTTVSSVLNPEDRYIDFNCFIISYEYNSTTYYWYYDNGSLGATTVAPSSNPSNLNDYYFVFQTNIGSGSGVAGFYEFGMQDNYYIYSPNNKKWMNCQANSSENNYFIPQFTNDTSAAIKFGISGPKSIFTYTYNNYDSALVGTNEIKGHKVVSYSEKTIFTIGVIEQRTTSQGAKYYPVDNSTVTITSGDTVVIAGRSVNAGTNSLYSTNDAFVMSTTQNEHNRSVVVSDFDEDGNLNYVTGLAEFTIEGNSSTGWTFLDSNSRYLYTQGKNNLYSSSDIGQCGDYRFWNIEYTNVSNGSQAIITNKSNTSYSYMMLRMQFTGTGAYKIFACYSNNNETDNSTTTAPVLRPRLYKKTTQTVYEDYSVAEEINFEAFDSGNKTIHTYDVLTAPTTVQDPGQVGNYSLFTVAETSSVSVNFNYSNSTVVYTAFATDTWVRVNSVTDLKDGDTVTFGYGPNNATPGTYDSTKHYYSAVTNNIFSGDYSKITTFDSNTTQYTFNVTNNGYTFYDKTESKYIGYTSSSYYMGLSSSLSDAYYWNITFNASFYALIQNKSSTSRYIKIDTSYNTFECSSETSGYSYICLYKKYEANQGAGNNTVYISESIGNNYDSSLVDVVGSATFTSTDIQISGSIATNNPVVPANKMGSKFYTTTYADNEVVLKIKKTGSRDLGTLLYSHDNTTASEPVFATGVTSSSDSTATYITLEDAGAKDGDKTNAVSYVFNFNVNNIKQMSLCALDADGNIVIAYDGSGNLASYDTANYSSQDLAEAAIAYYVVVIGNTEGTIHITGIDFTFTNVPGNVGDFGTVGYRSAAYNNLVFDQTADCTVNGTIINIYYSVIEGQQVSCLVVYDASTKTYTITFTSNVTTTINVFNYNPAEYSLVVNGEAYLGGTNVIAVQGS